MKHRHSQMPLPQAEVGQISEELELREEQEGPGEESFREAPPPRRRHIPLSHRTSLKVLAFVLCVLSILTAALSAFGAVMIAEEDLYTIPQETYLEDTLQNLATGDSYQLVRALLRGEEDPASFLLRGKNIRSVSVRFPEGGPMADWSWGEPAGGGIETLWYWAEIDSSLHLGPGGRGARVPGTVGSPGQGRRHHPSGPRHPSSRRRDPRRGRLVPCRHGSRGDPDRACRRDAGIEVPPD